MRYVLLKTVAIWWMGASCLASTYFITVSLPTNDLVYDSFSDTIYASVPSSAGTVRGNTITPINPHTGVLGNSVFVASEPSVLALADDGSRIYVASESTNFVTPFSLSTLTPGAAFPIGAGNRRVDDMEAAPGELGTLAVSRRFGNQNVGIAIFVDGVKLPNEQSDVAINDVIEFGETAATLYGHANSFSELDFNSFPVDRTPTGGIGPATYHEKFLLSRQGLDMEYEKGRMYFTNGQVLEVAAPGPIGSYAASGPVEPEGSVGRTYFVDGNTLKSFNQATFTPLGAVPIAGMNGSAKNLISLGDEGLAFATTDNQVIIARGSLIEGPSADFDEDGDVDGRDLLAWQRGLRDAHGSPAVSDSNGDGAVDHHDLAVWRRQYGTAAPTAELVPEPGWLSAVLCACLAIGPYRRQTNQLD